MRICLLLSWLHSGTFANICNCYNHIGELYICPGIYRNLLAIHSLMYSSEAGICIIDFICFDFICFDFICFDFICVGCSNSHWLSQDSCCKYNALFICIHGPPRPEGGWGIAVEMSGALTKVLPVYCHGSAEEIPGVCFI